MIEQPFVIAGGGVSPLLPSEYQQVEWIEAASSNGAYIDLGFAYDTACRYELEYYVPSTTSTFNAQIFGAAENNGVLRCMASAGNTAGTTSAYGSNGSTNIGITPSITVGKNNLLVASDEKNIAAINKFSSIRSTNQAAYTMTRNLYLLGQNYNTGYRGNGQKRVYSFKYWDKNFSLVRDMLPCYRKSDGVIGMYCMASNTFFTNAGSGSFTKGADV